MTVQELFETSDTINLNDIEREELIKIVRRSKGISSKSFALWHILRMWLNLEYQFDRVPHEIGQYYITVEDNKLVYLFKKTNIPVTPYKLYYYKGENRVQSMYGFSDTDINK